MKKVYVAIPYTGNEEASFKLVGNIPFSPISMTHPIALECKIEGNWEVWEKIDYAFIDWCDEILVVNYSNEAVEKSTGVQAEMKYVIDDNLYDVIARSRIQETVRCLECCCY